MPARLEKCEYRPSAVQPQCGVGEKDIFQTLPSGLDSHRYGARTYLSNRESLVHLQPHARCNSAYQHCARYHSCTHSHHGANNNPCNDSPSHHRRPDDYDHHHDRRANHHNVATVGKF